MPSAPLVTIVIPVFNDAETIATALESCLNQTMSDVEIICVDDASTDETPLVVQRYQELDPRIQLIRHDNNRSAFQARRAGILAASGDYVLFLDGDDELLPHAAMRAYDAARQQPTDLVGFGVEVVNPEGKVLGGYQKRLDPKYAALDGSRVLSGLFPIGRPAQGQLWRYLFRTEILRDAYALLPEDLSLPRVNDLPLLYLVATLASSYVSIPDRLYRYSYGSGGSGQVVESLEQAEFYADAIRSIDSIAPAVQSIARKSSQPADLIDSYESVRLSIIGYVSSYLLEHTREDLKTDVLDHLHTRAPATDIVVAAVRFYPGSLPALKAFNARKSRGEREIRSVLLTTRTLTTGGVSGVLIAQATFLLRAGYRVTIVARRYGSDRNAVPYGAAFVEMVGSGLPERLSEWAGICRKYDVDIVVDHQILYSRDWPEYALMARAQGVPTIGWVHSFTGRPIYDLNGLHAVLKDNSALLESVVTLSPLDVAFWKLRGVSHAFHVPNPPSPMMIEAGELAEPRGRHDGQLKLIWWGRLDERTKKVSELIEVAEQLRKLSVDFYLTVVGPDTTDWTAARFNQVVRKRRLTDYVRAVGAKHGTQLIEAIDNADAFISTSIIEGYQLTIAEAQSRALPVFMYELPWLTLTHENEGVVTAPQGDATALARAIEAVAAEPEHYAALSRGAVAAAKRALSYDFAELYEQVITGTLPASFSPDPSLDDAQQLLDLTIFFAEQNAGVLARATPPSAHTSKPKPKPKPKPKQPDTHAVPDTKSLGNVAWRVARPLGRPLLRLLPGLRPLAHRTKKRLAPRKR